MISIVKSTVIKFRQRCKICGSIVEYDIDDIKDKIHTTVCVSIKCPKCSTYLYHNDSKRIKHRGKHK